MAWGEHAAGRSRVGPIDLRHRGRHVRDLVHLTDPWGRVSITWTLGFLPGSVVARGKTPGSFIPEAALGRIAGPWLGPVLQLRR